MERERGAAVDGCYLPPPRPSVRGAVVVCLWDPSNILRWCGKYRKKWPKGRKVHREWRAKKSGRQLNFWRKFVRFSGAREQRRRRRQKTRSWINGQQLSWRGKSTLVILVIPEMEQNNRPTPQEQGNRTWNWWPIVFSSSCFNKWNCFSFLGQVNQGTRLLDQGRTRINETPIIHWLQPWLFPPLPPL